MCTLSQCRLYLNTALWVCMCVCLYVYPVISLPRASHSPRHSYPIYYPSVLQRPLFCTSVWRNMTPYCVCTSSGAVVHVRSRCFLCVVWSYVHTSCITIPWSRCNEVFNVTVMKYLHYCNTEPCTCFSVQSVDWLPEAPCDTHRQCTGLGQCCGLNQSAPLAGILGSCAADNWWEWDYLPSLLTGPVEEVDCPAANEWVSVQQECMRARIMLSHGTSDGHTVLVGMRYASWSVPIRHEVCTIQVGLTFNKCHLPHITATAPPQISWSGLFSRL